MLRLAGRSEASESEHAGGVPRTRRRGVRVRQGFRFPRERRILRFGEKLHEPVARLEQVRPPAHQREEPLDGFVHEAVLREDLGLDDERLDLLLVDGTGSAKSPRRARGWAPGLALAGAGDEADLGVAASGSYSSDGTLGCGAWIDPESSRSITNSWYSG